MTIVRKDSVYTDARVPVENIFGERGSAKCTHRTSGGAASGGATSGGAASGGAASGSAARG